MESMTMLTTHSTALRILQMFEEHDALQPSPCSIQDLKLVQHVTNLLDDALPWQRGHGIRTTKLARAIGIAAGLTVEDLHNLTLASLLHDIGLLALPERLISRLERLDFDSYAAVQCHPRLGAQWLERFRFLRRASVIIAHHHERWDGSGYPYGIRGTFIPREARILAIADAFDAIEVPVRLEPEMRNRIVYRILKAAAGTQFDPDIVELLDDRTGFPSQTNLTLT